jgi:hypothetical protein
MLTDPVPVAAKNERGMTPMQKQSSQWFIPVILAAGAGVALWFYWMKVSEPLPVAEPPAQPPPVVSEPGPGPLHPVEPVSPEPAEQAELVPLPPLDQSDDYFKLEIGEVFGAVLEDMLADTRLIERVVATVDSLPRAHVAERIRPLGRLDDPFVVDSQDDSGSFSISTDNYRRYDTLVTMALAADVNAVAELYRRYYPLFQDAYVDLGYPQGYFNDRLVEVIDDLLATPEISDPVPLVRPHVLYEYEDPDLEALSSGQKLLMRMGREHAGALKDRLRELRELITTM